MQKEELSFDEESWEAFLGRMYNGIIADNIFVKDRGDYIKISVEGFSNGEPVTYQFRLFTVANPERRLVQFMMEITTQLQEAQKVQNEFNLLKKRIQEQPPASQSTGLCFDNDNSMDFGYSVVDEQISKKPSGVQKKKVVIHMKRKPGYSLVNPHSKRRVARGAKIGEE